MPTTIGVVMDPIERIKPYKDTTLALLLAAQRRGWRLHYYELADLFLIDGCAMGRSRPLTVADANDAWYRLEDSVEERPLGELDAILMRVDPPFDMRYIYATYVLERAEAAGALVVNRPQALRDANEKMFTAWFSHCCPPTLVSSNPERLQAFWQQHGDIVVKPLDGMGGAMVFRLKEDDPNVPVILELQTHGGRLPAMAQRYLPAIVHGDKRVLLVDGEPIPYALARIPAHGETRANLAAGGRGEGIPLGDRERWICEQVGPTLREKGLLFVGLDIIGDYLTEINVTSPTCVRELDAQFDIDIGDQLMAAIARRLEPT